jgi:carbamate kinase
MKKIVIALGGNALGNTLDEQMAACLETAKAIADLVEAGNQVVIAHGNGPQVGMINLAFEAASKTEAKSPIIPMSVCVAMSQGYIGSDLQNTLRSELISRGIYKSVATLITHTVVDAEDPAFKNPNKPIGSFYSQAEAEEMTKNGFAMMEDAGRGWRRVVASPKPIDIVEIDTVKAMLDAGQIPITVGGGGIPVKKVGNSFEGASAVVDKDFASAKVAELLDADMLIILTAVEKVAMRFGKPDVEWLDELSVEDAEKYIAEGHFAPGSMLPKVQAALSFAKSKPGHKALITELGKAKDGLAGKTGPVIIA